SGTVRYWNGSAGVSNAAATLTSSRVYTSQSGASGAFTVAGADAGSYTLALAKSDEANGLSAYDASLALQHDAGLITLSGNAFTAGDVDKSGQVTAFDAFYILQASVGNLTLPFPGAGVVWEFVPASRSYASLSANQSGQDFTAILLGDVSGNWMSAALTRQSVLVSGLSSVVRGQAKADGRARVPSSRETMAADVSGQVDSDRVLTDAATSEITARRSLALPDEWKSSLVEVRGQLSAKAEVHSQQVNPVKLSVLLDTAAPAPGQQVERIAIKAPATNVLSLDLRMTYDPASAAVAQVQLGPLAGGMSMAVNTNQAGMILAGLAGALPISGEGAVLIVTFNAAAAPLLQLTTAQVNEGEVPSEIPVNTAPVLAAIGNQTINEGATLTLTASATDADSPANTLTYSLVSPPAGATINPLTGVFSWTPTTAQSPSTNTITVKVMDNGSPSLSDTKSFTVVVEAVFYQMAGTLKYWKNARNVPGVLLNLGGDRVATAPSDANGAFVVGTIRAGSYTLTPSKSDQINGISAYDASLALQHDAGLITLTGNAFTAADADKSGQVMAFDAFYILQKSVDLIPLPFPGAGVVWDFVPQSRIYPNLTGDQSGQDFTAILLGDVSGNWSAGGGAQATALNNGRSAGLTDSSPRVTLALRALTTRSSETQVWLLARAAHAEIYSVDLRLSYDSAHGLKEVRSGAIAAMLAMSSNTNQPGLVRVALAEAVPLCGLGALLLLTLPSGAGHDLQIVSASIDEGAVPVEIDPAGASFERDADNDGQTDWAEVRAGTDPFTAAEARRL
ncbi:MAG: hypothetical protein HY674_00455, partial [Chloroflexi bacterium]|nr:hypothetical protein [Chloroflexota bacterium]